MVLPAIAIAATPPLPKVGRAHRERALPLPHDDLKNMKSFLRRKAEGSSAFAAL